MGITIREMIDADYFRDFKVIAGQKGLHKQIQGIAILDALKQISGFAMKGDRYLQEIPMKVIKAFEDHGVPLLLIPSEPSWMEIMNQLNVLVMNKSIKRFGIGRVSPKSYSNLSYQSRKIDKILSQIEREMNFPAML